MGRCVCGGWGGGERAGGQAGGWMGAGRLVNGWVSAGGRVQSAKHGRLARNAHPINPWYRQQQRLQHTST